MSNGFSYYAPTRIVFGRQTEMKVGELVKSHNGHKVLIHYGGGSALRSGLLDRIRSSLRSAQIGFVELGGVVPNPRLSLVYQGIELGRREKVDFLLAVGGGSVIDSAKAIAYGLADEGDVWDLYAHTRRARAAFPVGAVLTIAAAGSEMSDSSVITKEEGGIKRGYNDDLCRLKFAVMNPELTLTVSSFQTACGCVDIMMHTMERYFVNGGNLELTDRLAEGLLRTVKKYAEILHHDPQNYEARAEVMWAGSLAHNGLTACGTTGFDFATHMLEHEVGGIFDVAHAAGLSAIWGSWARYVYKECLPRFVQFAVRVMDIPESGTPESIALQGIEAMEDFYRRLDMPTSFRELGIAPTEEQMRLMASKCARATGGHKGSAKVLYEADMYNVYKMVSERP